jgi:hypothetical protein
MLKYGNLFSPLEETSIPQSRRIFEFGVCNRIQLLPTCLAEPRKVNLAHSSVLSGFQSV